MKNQYFGDVNDYKKYGLLRAIVAATGFRILVAWMLTPDDDGPDGRFTEYLDKPQEYKRHDPTLFEGLKSLISHGRGRQVALIEYTDLIPKAEFFSDITPDGARQRTQWFALLLQAVGDVDLVFFDPDNGLEVKSKPYGRRLSSKYLYWREAEEIWSRGKSLLIYQHYVREKRAMFTQRMLEALHTATPNSFVEAFSTANVVFLLSLQPEHQHLHGSIVDAVQATWNGRIRHWDLVRR